MKTRLCLSSIVVAATALLLPTTAAAQKAAGEVFLQVFNVGGAAETVTTQNGFVGSVGCGATGPGSGDAGGADLIAVLNAALDTPNFDDSAVPVAERRELFRFCDDLTQNAFEGGWDADVAGLSAVQLQQEGLAPDQLFMQNDQAAALASIQINNVSQRIAQIRLARRGLDNLSGYALERGETAQPMLAQGNAFGPHAREMEGLGGEAAFAAALARGFSSGDEFLGVDGLSIFVNGQYTRLDQSNSSKEVGSDGNGGGFTLGIDKQLGENAFLGLAFGYSRLHTEYNRSFGDSDLDDFSFSLYGSNFFNEQLYVDGIISGSVLDFDQTRKVPASIGPAYSKLNSDPDGWNITGDFGFGGDFEVKPFDLNPYLRFAVSHTDIDSFNEKGSTLALSLRSQDNTSITLLPGLSVAVPISASFGVVSPYVRAEYVHEFGDQADDIRGNLTIVPEAGFKLKPTSTSRNYANVGGGATLTLGNGISAFADYNAVLGISNLVVHTATLGGRLAF
jgi:outer membrane autotransporter protein